VRAVRDAGVLVVAASGNRPQQGAPFDEDFADETAAPDEDAVGILYPTSYDEVISASTTADGSGSADVTELVVKNSNTTVAVPTWDAISYGLDGRRCVLEPAATSWAAAEVSGVLALLWQMFPDDTASQIQARLVTTANGTPDDPNPLTGAGVVQPYEALTRPLDPSRSGKVERSSVAAPDTAPATAPEPREDLLADTRDDAVWWGLVGGGMLVVALLLRPVLARRRS
jgi:membrane-anchored mycosin MYCP